MRVFSRLTSFVCSLMVVMSTLTFSDHARAIDLREVSNSVVKLFVTHQYWNITQPWNKGRSGKSICSGFFIKEGILTNAHCIVSSTYIEIEIPGDPDKHEARLIAVNHQTDLALIELVDKTKKPKSKFITFDDLPELREKVVTVGYPTGGRQISFTEGVVSRVDIMSYAHSGVSGLMVQTDAAINPGNSGGPVFSDRTGESLGVATQRARKGGGIGYFVPVPVVKQFLKDIKDGTVEGIPMLGMYYQGLENPTIREYLKMKDDQSGIRVLRVGKGTSVDGILEVDDVIIEVDGHTVLNDARIPFRKTGKIGMLYPIVQKQVGDKVSLKIIRDGKTRTVKFELKKYHHKVIPTMADFDSQPRYFELAGLVFRPVERRYLRAMKRIPLTLRKYGPVLLGDVEGLDELVVVSSVFAANVNKGYSQSIEDIRVMKINGKEILKLQDVVDAFDEASDQKYYEIELENTVMVILDREKVEEEQAAIRERYNITAMKQ